MIVSIVIPVRNESKFIIPCLRSITAQDMPLENIELLLVDGRSDDGTINLINSYLKNSPKAKELRRWEILDNPNQTAPYAMNLGIRAARGEIILRFDGHSVMAPDYVSNCVKYLEQTKADNVGGPMRAVGISAAGRAIALAHQSPFGLGGGAFHSDFEGFADTAYLGCFPKETFAKYGLYDTRLTRNQDIEFNARIRKGIIKRTADRGSDYAKAPSDRQGTGPDSSDSKAGSSPFDKDSATHSPAAQGKSQNDMNNLASLCPFGLTQGMLGGEKENDLRKSAQSAASCEVKKPGFPIGSGMTTGREEHKKEENFVPLCLCGKKPEKEENDLRKSAQSADREAPGKIYLTPAIRSYYRCRETLSGLWSQNFKNGQWVVYTKYIAPYALSLRHFIPLVFVTSILLLLALSCSLTPPCPPRSGEGLFGLGTVCLLLLVVELLAYFGAMLYFIGQAWRSVQRKAESGKALSEKRKAESGETKVPPSSNNYHLTTKSIALLPIVFLTLHFSYGLGSLWGLITLPLFVNGKFKK